MSVEHFAPWRQQPQGGIAGVEGRFGRALHWQAGAQSMAPASPVPGNSAQTLEVTSQGIGLATNLDLRGTRYGSTDGIPSALSLIVVVQLRIDASNRGIFGNWSNTSSNNYIQVVQTGGVGIRVNASRGGTSGFADRTGLPLHTPHVAVLTSDGAGVDFWVNGDKVATVAGIGTGGLSAAGQFWQTGQYYSNDSARHGNNTVMMSAVVDRVLSPDDIRLVSGNPWQLFAPRRIWVPQSAGGGDTQNESGGASATVSITAAGSGSAQEAATGGAGASVAVSSVGTGTAAEQASGGASAGASVSAVGTGTATEAASGGASAGVTVSAAGAGTASEAGAESGGASATVTVSASGAGTAAEAASGGAGAVVAVSAAGAGSASEEGAQSGGASAAVLVTASGAGLALEIAFGGASAVVSVSAAGAGTGGDTPSWSEPVNLASRITTRVDLPSDITTSASFDSRITTRVDLASPL